MNPPLPNDAQFLKAAQRKRPDACIPMYATAYKDPQSIIDGKVVDADCTKRFFGIDIPVTEGIFIADSEAQNEIP